MRTASAKKQPNTKRSSARNFIYLTACMLQNVPPDKERLRKMNFAEIRELAERHMLSSALYMTLERADALPLMDPDLSGRWRMRSDAVIRQNILMNYEREAILSRFESEGIWYMPLKGCIIADYYPDFGMREMSDNDILYDGKYQEKVRDIMVDRGYRVQVYDEADQDVYVKEPVYTFEMHKDLMNRLAFPDLYAYFSDISGKLIRDADREYGRHFSNEDFYIYFIGHAYKHYEYAGGTGLRSLADAYLINRRFGMDREYLDREFRKLRVTEFERDLAHLAETVFGEPESIYRSPRETGLTYQERKMLEDILGAGVYGTKNNKIRKQLVRDGGREKIRFRTRVTYILHRIYPKGQGYLERYPFFYKHVWAYVFLPVYRLILRGNLKSLIREARMALKTR